MEKIILSKFPGIKAIPVKLKNPNSKKLKEYEAAMKRGLAKLAKEKKKLKVKAKK